MTKPVLPKTDPISIPTAPEKSPRATSPTERKSEDLVHTRLPEIGKTHSAENVTPRQVSPRSPSSHTPPFFSKLLFGGKSSETRSSEGTETSVLATPRDTKGRSKTDPSQSNEKGKRGSVLFASLPDVRSFSIHPDNVISMDIAQGLSHFTDKVTKTSHGEKEAAGELSNYYKTNPEQKEGIIQFLGQFRQELQDKHWKRFDDTLVQLALDPSHAELVQSYFLKRGKQGLDLFANHLMKELLKILHHDKEYHANILTLLSAFIKTDFVSEKPETWSREVSLSTLLCKEYALHLWKEDLESLKKGVHKILKTHDISKLWLDREPVKQSLEKDPSWTKLPYEEQCTLIEKKLSENAICFKRFAQDILEQIYIVTIPLHLGELLRMYRAHISDFLQKFPEKEGIHSNTPAQPKWEEKSRSYVAGWLFLRVLNPVLSESHPEIENPIITVTKITQCLANECSFSSAKIFSEVFNEILEVYAEPHKHFIEAHTMWRKKL